ncbi:response regulator [Erwinia pyrifoliae]|uniref:Response regulator n=1 Tax=Erwinia pyrifoliae TaxID=79967 RepID=A0ABY5XE83_ERWPY|nr:response regulator [Erwinia pyrifoliae]AUX74513.1 response regulator [Erwinia pyrifoliae]MCA8876431.1 response regulator [Erwinia pyrifoliae]MCT2386547.1 response regulator [Erwinia pyrifoliae]MCU8587856.1 response regulator [Erwinia pyrifoliae]UWS31779.1 response regulator [Erwinia pyrifoliae]
MMDKKTTNLEKVRDLLEKKGVDKRKQSSTLAEILGIKYNSAKQKLDEKRSISITEIKKIYRYFNDSFDGSRDYNCVFVMNDMHVRCNVDVDPEVAVTVSTDENYAVKDGQNYVIDASQKRKNANTHRVKKLEFLPAPKIAILDNDADILELLQSVCSRFGIEAETFQTKDEILKVMSKQTFDCFIIDWLLDYGENSEQVIEAIREKNEKCTIILLTGQLNQHEKDIGKAIMKYGVEIIEKPTRTFIISSILLNNLFFKD